MEENTLKFEIKINPLDLHAELERYKLEQKLLEAKK